ncbi:hypothetical protein P280DRAFT_472174 [Massarina eburnea CBS 473.64]|uniref:Uncharacterized protein n=1 Tax=Massarina eburnea CBS 473.64 TaxID=1395130 RepID=A0A6A6RTW4_9PLEO|nr:hypothetical protein P280DRAFT_472174 [Massarina eburnea CBS 473.64]
MQLFASQLRPGQQTTRSLRASQYKRPHRRRRDEHSDESPDEPPEEVAGDAAPSTPSSSRVPSNAKIQEGIAGLEPAVYAADVTSRSDAVGGKSEKSGLRRSHLDVLTTVMHRCLLEGHYDRASRAWGLILRSQVPGGKHIDPRNHGRWGIGAELLLRHKSRTNSNEHEHEHESNHDDEEPYSREAFDLARNYYERFIVQYNHLRTLPNAVDSRVFYPALFSVWIRDILDQSEQARKRYRKEHQHRSSSLVDSDDDSTAPSKEARDREAAIQAEELSSARQLCEKLDSEMKAPPYDKLPGLLCLRANVGLWISDLLLSSDEAEEEDDNNDNHSFESASRKPKRYARSLRELETSLGYFKRAEENGAGNLSAAKSAVEVKMKSLAKQMARFDG